MLKRAKNDNECATKMSKKNSPVLFSIILILLLVFTASVFAQRAALLKEQEFQKGGSMNILIQKKNFISFNTPKKLAIFDSVNSDLLL